MEKASRIVWITGASSGIGASLAKCFARNGDCVVASARSLEKLLQIQEELHESDFQCDVAVCDMLNASSIEKTMQGLLAKHKHIDVLINNAGATYFKDFMDTSIEEFDHVIQTNLRGTFLASKAALPSMLERGSGLIMNVLSFVAKKLYTKSSAYSASKAGSDAMMNVLREEVRRKGINIVNIYPGAVRTPIWPAKQQQLYVDQMLSPQEVAELIYGISIQPPSMMIEEITFRPRQGDLHVS